MKRFKKKFKNWVDFEKKEEEGQEDYLHIKAYKKKPSFLVKSFVLKEFEEIKDVLKEIRKGNIIVLIDLKPIKENDAIDLRRAVNKLKSVTSEIDGEIAGLSGDWIVITPEPITIEKLKTEKKIQKIEEEEI